MKFRVRWPAPQNIITAISGRMGATPGQVYRHIRLSAARHLVESSSLQITEIAVRTGYESPAALTRAFKNALVTRQGDRHWLIHDNLWPPQIFLNYRPDCWGFDVHHLFKPLFQQFLQFLCAPCQNLGHKGPIRFQNVEREIGRGLAQGNDAQVVGLFVTRTGCRHIRHHDMRRTAQPFLDL